MKKSIFVTVKIDPVSKAIEPATKADQIQLDMFLKNFKADSEFQLILSLKDDDSKTLPQLAKIHGLIKDISIFSGMTYTEVKDHIKKEASLWEYNGLEILLKSFKNCTKKELDSAIKTAEIFAANIGCVTTV